MQIKRVRVQGKNYYVKKERDGKRQKIATTLSGLFSSTEPKGDLPGENEFRTAQILVPCEPTKIVCVGLNYRLHAEETGKPLPKEPLLFLKPPTSLLPHRGEIKLPLQSHEVHYEGELALVIKTRATAIRAQEAEEYILGYTILNDVTARDLQRQERIYTRCKGFDTFAPVGPHIVSGLDPLRLHLKTFVNGVLKQSSPCDDMIFRIPQLLEFISSIMTLVPGDIVTTGTPSGVGALHQGDTVRVEISGIGALENTVGRR